MRVLLANTRHFRGGGDSTYAFNLADLLLEKGIQVAFFAMEDPRNLPDPNSDLFVSHIDFRELNRRKSPATALKVMVRAIYSVEARHKFRHLIDRFKPDVVHLQNIHAHITPSIIFEARKHEIPVVWTLHDYKLLCPNSHYLIDSTSELCEACGTGRYYQAVAKRCKKASALASGAAAVEALAHRLMRVRDKVDAYLAPSLFLRSKLIQYGFPEDRIHHLPYVLTRESFCDRREQGDYLLFLGKLEPLKGLPQLLAACRLTPEVKLVLAGRVDEPLASQLPRILPPSAHYVGLKQAHEVEDLLRRCLAVVLPSIWYENQPLSILEAFASGKPVIASDLGGMTELVKDGERGILTPPGNPEAIADAFRLIWTDREGARAMGENAFRYVREQHAPDAHYAKLASLYQALIARGGLEPASSHPGSSHPAQTIETRE